ncbi:MAG: HepT-like ribonuclease domain-containing protein [Thermoproteota archaeon]|jgi:uncharacterized protein YutE (UPF0331/DUF86 family)/predicted nucleotidyltransferase|nr:HepT-like ribonuclease domain-containing protein [Thermoproteota archaeon]
MTKNKLTIDHVLPRLKELFEKFENVETAILFGSIARNKFSVHDIDIALKLNKEDLLETGYIITQIAKTLHINEDHIDIVLLNQANPITLSKILKEGIIIKAQPNIIEQLLQKAEQAPDAIMEIEHWATFDPKLDKMVIISRTEEIRRNTEFIKSEILSKKIEDLNYKDMLALERAMQKIIEAMLDICRHLVSVYLLDLAESYEEYPQKLTRANKMSKDLAEYITRLVGLRNMLVNQYLEISNEILYQTANETTEKIVSKFIEWTKTIDLNYGR